MYNKRKNRQNNDRITMYRSTQFYISFTLQFDQGQTHFYVQVADGRQLSLANDKLIIFLIFEY